MKRKIANNNFLKFVLIPVSLLGLWFILTFLQIIFNDESLTVIKESYYSHELQAISSKAILKGEKRNFTFKAAYDNLGIVSIDFNTFDRFNYDKIVFRIKERNQKNWYYEQTVNTRALTSLQLYPFGFPIISDSKGKEYQIEIHSINGSEDSSVALDSEGLVFSAGYQFDKDTLLQNNKYLLDFLFYKTINSLVNYFLLFASSIYLYPFIFYMLWLLVENRIKSDKLIHNPFVALVIIAVIIDVVFNTTSFDIVYLLISALWFVTIIVSNQNSNISYVAAIILFFLCLFLEILGLDTIVEGIAAWAYLALIVGFILNIYESKTSKIFAKK